MAPESKTAVRNSVATGKKRKRYLPHNKPVKKKGSYPLRPGVQGFFITCDGGREHQASREALNILESFYEELVHGENSDAKELPKRALNTKITFADSDTSSSDDDDDEDDGDDEEEVVQEGDEEKGEKKHKTDEVSNGDNASHGNGAGEKSDAAPKSDGVEAEALDKADDNKGDIDSKADDNKGDIESKADDNKGDIESKADDNKGDIESKADELPAVKQCSKTDALSAPTCGSNDKVEHKSIDRLIEAELEELGDKTKRRFVKLDSGCNGVVFVQMRKKDGDKSPKDIVHKIVTTAASTRKHMSRFILRILPIEVACYASNEEISRAIKPLVEQNFPEETENPYKFAVLYEARANSGIDRLEIINTVAQSIPKPHKVDLNNPDKTIVVEIARTVCMIGIIEKYKEYSKYNLRQLTSRKA